MYTVSFNNMRQTLAVLALAVATPALGLPDDRQQPISIVSDQAERNEKSGTTVYRGAVELTQGSLHIQSDQLEIHSNAEGVYLIVASGTPAQLKQQPNPGEAEIHASAKTMRYFVTEDKLQLQDQAEIERDGAIVRSSLIDYFINEEVVRADSPDERVHVVIPPSLNNGQAQ